MITNKKLNVFYKEQLVGTLAAADYRVAFEYADSWIENGFAISPFSLPLEKKVFLPSKLHFQGLLNFLSILMKKISVKWSMIILFVLRSVVLL